VGRFLEKTRSTTETGTTHKGARRRPNLAQPGPRVTGPACGREGLTRPYKKGGGLQVGDRVYPIRPPPRSSLVCLTDPLAPPVLAAPPSLDLVPPCCSSTCLLLRRRTAPVPLLPSVLLSFSHRHRSVAWPDRRVLGPRRTAFAGWGGEAGEPSEYPVAARTQ
jgi:hypothetical protein